MGLKSNIVSAPIIVAPEPTEVTPSVTPMRPTPLVGDWCDLPCAWNEESSSKNGTPAGKKQQSSPDFTTDSKEQLPADPQPEKQQQHGDDGAPKPEGQQQLSFQPTEELACHAPQEFVDEDNLFIATPSESWFAEASQSLPDPSGQSADGRWQCHHPYRSHTSWPSHHNQVQKHANGAGGVPSLPPPLGFNASLASPVVLKPGFQQPNGSGSGQCLRRGGIPHQRPQRHAGNGCPRRPSAISRFMPPPPPTSDTCNVLIKNGGSFEKYYAIVMRWYSRVLAATAVHAELATCPRAEQYLYNFDGWVNEINFWWTSQVSRRSAMPTRAR